MADQGRAEADDGFERTWDGEPIAKEPPFGAAIVVYRRAPAPRAGSAGARGPTEFLVLHRGQRGPDFEGEWAWGPPAGARHPDEPIAACAARELREEAGLLLALTPVEAGAPDWFVYLAEAPFGAEVRLSDEHDRYRWAPVHAAAALMSPPPVRDSFLAAARLVEGV